MQYRPHERMLDIAFRDGRGVYRYFDVPEAVWKAFRSASSKGTYLNRTFKAGGYGYERLTDSKQAIEAMHRSALESGTDLFWGEPFAGESKNQ